jgi:hypothetical protein
MSRDYGNLAPGRYTVDEYGVAVKQHDGMRHSARTSANGFVLQGIATETGKCCRGKDGNVLYLNHGCFDASIDSGIEVSLLLDHDSKSCIGTTTNNKLAIYAGSKGVAFRFTIPESWSKDLADHADDFETYVPVSIGLKDGSATPINIDGTQVASVDEAKLYEVSILSKAPAIHSTYARIVSLETCGTLQHDYDSGRLDLVGKYIGIHRAYKASENGGVVKYHHVTSPYDRAASRFVTALQTLAE